MEKGIANMWGMKDNLTEQNRTEQNRTEQNRTEQNWHNSVSLFRISKNKNRVLCEFV